MSAIPQRHADRVALKGSDVFIRALENEGVQYIFGVPGRRISTFLSRCMDPRFNL